MEQLSAALKEYQEQNDLSLRGLAREFDVATGTAEGWVKGWRKPDYKHLPIIIEKIEVDEITIYRWLTDDDSDDNFGYRIRPEGLPTYVAEPVAA